MQLFLRVFAIINRTFRNTVHHSPHHFSGPILLYVEFPDRPWYVIEVKGKARRILLQVESLHGIPANIYPTNMYMYVFLYAQDVVNNAVQHPVANLTAFLPCELTVHISSQVPFVQVRTSALCSWWIP